MSDTQKFDGKNLGEVMHQFGNAVLHMGAEHGLNQREIYLVMMYVAGGLAAANEVPIDYPPAVKTFKMGFDSYESFVREK